MKKKGFTLIELLISFSIFALVVVAFIGILVTMLGLQTDQSAAAEVNQQGQSLLQQIQYYVSTARLVDMTQDVATGTLTLREFSAQYPTTITLTGGVVYITPGGASVQSLTSGNVSVSNLSFTRHYNLNGSSTPYGTDSVSFSFTISAASTNNKQYSQSFQSSATVVAPVGKIALIQEAENASWCGYCGYEGTFVSFPNDSEAGDLLVGVIDVQDEMATQTFSMYASTGGVWNQIGNLTDANASDELAIFDYVMASGTTFPLEVMASDTWGFASSSVFIFEYRGTAAATSTLAIDASSSQAQIATANPSSGFVNPTSTVELIFGATNNDNTTEIPAVGPGFILEASSTYGTYIEDSVQYITGPVAATWQYATLPTSLTAVATFK